jgi:DHA1 family bicyclomycin/chloramphenicol resistance-like MFS transporter
MTIPPPAAGPPSAHGSGLRRSWSLAALLAALSMIGPFAIDMYLPAFPAIGNSLHAAPIAVQQTLSAYLFAYAVMMLWHGALTDALGRRRVVLGGLAVFAVATLGAAIAGNIETLWLFRALQGLSAGTGLVAGRAIIRDSFHGAEAQRLMSQITMVFAVAPAIAPVLGGLLLNTLGWRSIFWALLVFVVGVIVWAAKRLPETHPRELRQPLHPRALWHSYRTVLRRADFLLLALIPALNFSAFFLYIASAPAFLIDLLGVTTWGFAWLFVPMIAGVTVGAFLSGRLAGHRSPKATVRLGYALLFTGAAANVLICSLVTPKVALNVLPIMIYTIGSSIVMPSATLLMLDLFPTLRGMASSLQGFVQFGISGFTAGTIAPLLSHSLSALALGMTAFTTSSFLLWLVYQRHARPQLKAWKP